MNKHYAICYNSLIEHSKEVMEKLKSILDSNGTKYDVLSIDNLKSGYDFAFVIGGDGTILKAGRFYSKYDTPIFGINLGHLGFLSQASRDDLELAVKQILSCSYNVEERMMLKCNNNVALNDFVVKGEESSRATRFSLQINDKFVCEYFADGIIISTPTGSTAYGMAAGGPVLSPDVDAISIIPICPHTFSARPIVVSGNDKIKILSYPNQKYIVSADGQEVFTLAADLLIEKSENVAKLSLLKDNDFFSILRNKLHWGIFPACTK